MKFSWKWLNEIVDLNDIPINEIKQTLTLAGFEVEKIENKPSIQDQIIEISVTSNRSDVSNMIGLAREISTIFNTKLKEPYYESDYEYIKNLKNNVIFQSDILLDLEIRTIQLVKQNDSPNWLKNYLIGCGVEPTNILLDISRYINIKWGQDIEILDLDNHDNTAEYNYNSDINIINNYDMKNHESIYQLLKLNTCHKLPFLEIITYQHFVLSILGVISNSNFYCHKNSRSLLVIGQICKPEYLRRLLLEIKNKTHRTNQHIRGMSRYDFYKAYNETIELILSLNKGFLRYKNYTYHNNIQSHTKAITIKEESIQNILGPCLSSKNCTISPAAIYKILQQLKFKPQYINGNFFVKVPEYRCTDIKREVDIIEEIVRIHGFDKYLDQLPNNHRNGYTSQQSQFIKKARNILRSLGLHEVIHYSLDSSYLDNGNNIKICNPVLKDQKTLKKNLIEELVKTATYNNKQKNLPLECFEIGKTFQYSTSTYSNYKEYIHIAGILGNPSFSRKLWSEKEQELTWFQAKGILEDFFEKLNTKVYWLDIQNYTAYQISYYCKHIYHPYRTAILYSKDRTTIIGIFGQMSTKAESLFYNSHHHYIFEININNLIKTVNNSTHLNYNLKSYSIYPCITRDISLTIPINKNVQFVQEYILKKSFLLIESVNIFNEYQKDNSNRQVGFRITYRSQNRTLDDKDIQKIEEEIKELLRDQL